MLYMSDRYGLEIYSRQRKLLQRWQELDPPDAMERRRNERIEAVQGNRNPLIDR
jgi:deoxyribonuclease-1